jgi:hypothetical protein
MVFAFTPEMARVEPGHGESRVGEHAVIRRLVYGGMDPDPGFRFRREAP